MKTAEELAAELAAKDKELAEANALLAKHEEGTLVEQLAQSEAAKAIEATKAETDRLNEAVYARAKAITDAAMAPRLATIFGGLTISPRLEIPEKLRGGNLTKADRQFLDAVFGRTKATMTSLTEATGGAWVPTELASELLLAVDLANLVGQHIRTVESPSDPYVIPGLSAHIDAEYRAEGTGHTGASPTTTKNTIDHKKLIAEIPFPYELEEDSIIPVIPALKDDIAKALANGEERAILWGDDTTTAANNIDKNVAATDPQLAFNGLWYTVKNGTATWYLAYGTSWPASIRALRRLMGKYAIDPTGCLVVVGTYVYDSMRQDSNLVTWDKAGPQAVVLTGMLPNAEGIGKFKYGFFDGMPVVVSPYMYMTDATGVRLTTVASNTKYSVLLVMANRVILGRRRQIGIELWRDVRAQLVYLVGSERVGLVLPDGGTTGAYGALYNG